MNICFKILLSAFLITFLICYEYSFGIGLLSLLIIIILFFVKIFKKIHINYYLKITVFLFILEILSILSYIKISILQHSIYSCEILSKFSSNGLIKLDRVLNLRILLTEQIINCNIKNGSALLLDNIKNNNYYDSSKKYKDISYIYKYVPTIEPLSGKSYNKLYSWANNTTKILLDNEYQNFIKKENSNNINYITFDLFSEGNEKQKTKFLNTLSYQLITDK